MVGHLGDRMHLRYLRDDRRDHHVGHLGHLDRPDHHGHRDHRSHRTWLASALGLGGWASWLAMDDVRRLGAQNRHRSHPVGQHLASRSDDLHPACHLGVDPGVVHPGRHGIHLVAAYHSGRPCPHVDAEQGDRNRTRTGCWPRAVRAHLALDRA